MTQDLQQLLDRIRQEGVEKAQAEAKTIVEAARKEAADTVAKAKAEAEALRKGAERDAEASKRNAEQSIRQSVRDVRLQLTQDLQKLVSDFLLRDVKSSLQNGPAVSVLVREAVEAYLRAGEKEMTVELGGAAASLAESLRAEIAKAAGAGGVKVEGSAAFPEGFTIRLAGGRVEQCFTDEAVTDALARLLRPQIAALLQ